MTDRDQPQIMRKDCGCVLNIWPDTVRTDFCQEHAKAEIIDAKPEEKTPTKSWYCEACGVSHKEDEDCYD